MRRITVLLDKEYEKHSSIPEGCEIISTYIEVKSFISDVEEKRIKDFVIFTTSIELMTLVYDNELYICYRGVCHQIKPGYVPSNGDIIWHGANQRLLREKLDNNYFEWQKDTTPDKFKTPSLGDRLSALRDPIHIDDMNNTMGYDFKYIINKDTIDCIGDEENHTVVGQVMICYIIAMMYVLKEAEKKAVELYDNERVVRNEYAENGVVDLYKFLYDEMDHTPEKYLNKFDRLLLIIREFFNGTSVDVSDLKNDWKYYAMTKASETGFIQNVFRMYTYTGDLDGFSLDQECYMIRESPIMCYRMFEWLNDLLAYFLREGIPESIYY